jgi:peptidyl-prolyl cis-trans isomerase C
LKQLFNLGAVLALAVTLAACVSQPGAAPATGDAAVMARVGSGVITTGDLKRALQPGADPQQALDQLIDVELVVQAARAEGVGIDPADIDEQIEQIRQTQGGGTAEGFSTFLTQNNIGSEQQLREILVRQQLIDAMILAHSMLEQARASHILLQAQDDAAKQQRKPEADELLAQLQNGGDFAALAREKSEDPGSGAQGGDLGWQPRGVFVPEFDEAIFSMQKGELRLVETQFGWHIIRLDEEPQVKALENREALQTPTGQQAFETAFLPWVESLRATADQNGQISIVGDPAALAQPAPVDPNLPLDPSQPPPVDPSQPVDPGQPAPTAAP